MAMIASPLRRPAAATGLAALLALSACAGPGPITSPTPGAYAPAGEAAKPPAAAPSNEYTAVAGDTVYTVAQRYGIGVRALIDENKLQPPYALQPGRQLRIPPQREHIVQSGETVYAIARRYEVPMAELVRVNNLPQPYTIRVGQRLRLPDPAGQVETAAAPPATGTAPSVATSAIQVVELPPPGGAPTPLTPSYVAPTTPSAPPSGSGTLTASTPTAAEGATLPTPISPAVAPPVSNPALQPNATPTVSPPTAAAPAESAALIAPPVATPKGFIWPVRGELVSRFGDKGTGLRNDGINIAAPKGTPVVAAESGVVAYSGNELKGFGNLVLIRHPNGWVTAYAHNDTLLVARGEQVARGQEIARVGSTGNVSSPQLHFEVRRGGERIDPLSVMGGEGDGRKTGLAPNPNAFPGGPPSLG